MYTEAMLKDFTLDALIELMALKLEELKELGDPPKDFELYYIQRVEIDLIQKVIDEKRENNFTTR
jgi:hypothetical protein